MSNLSFWSNPKERRRAVVLRLTWVLSVWPLLLFLWKEVTSNNNLFWFLLSSHIACLTSSLRCPLYTCRCNPTLSLGNHWSSFFHFLLKCWIELHTAHKTLGSKSTLLLLSTLFIVIFITCSTCEQQHKAIFYSSISHSFDVANSIICCCDSNPLPKKSSRTLKHIFPQHYHFQGGPVFKWQRKED